MNTGLILAAGSSSRFKSKIPKQFSSFKDRMIIDYSVDTFLKHKSIDDIIIVVSKEYLSLIKDKYPNLILNKNDKVEIVHFIWGG